MRCRFAAGRHDRGVILIIALLLILALTGIGLVAAQTVSNDLNLTGNSRVSQVARNIASAGTEGTLTLAALGPRRFYDFVDNLQRIARPLEMNDLATSFFDTAMDGSGSFGRDGVSMNTAFWTGTVQAPWSVLIARGYDVDTYYFQRYVFQLDGFYRNDLPASAPNARTLTIDRSSQARSMAVFSVGPVGP